MCIAALAADAPGAAAGGPDPAMNQAGPWNPRTAAAIPLMPSPFPDGVRLDLGATSSPRDRPARRSVAFREAGRHAPDAGLQTATPARTSRFSDRLMARMETEARRYRSERLFDASGGRFPLDSVGQEQRAREAERIFTRALDKTLDDQIEQLARTSLGLGGFLEWLDDFGGLRLGHGSPRTARSDLLRSAQPAGGGSAARGVAAFNANLGLRLGVHPRLILKTEFLGLRGRLEVPLLEEALRLSVERPLGRRSRASLSGGLSRDGDDWASFTLNLEF